MNLTTPVAIEAALIYHWIDAADIVPGDVLLTSNAHHDRLIYADRVHTVDHDPDTGWTYVHGDRTSYRFLTDSTVTVLRGEV